jgi:type II secretory pathway component GspD/PulD (secretin)
MVIQPPALAGAIHIAPSKTLQSLHLRGPADDVIRNVAAAYGIRAVIDESVVRNELRFDLENASYQQAMRVLMDMTHGFAVPLDATSILFARDVGGNRARLEPLVEETISLPEATAEQLTSLSTMIRTIFEVRQTTSQPSSGSIIVRAPEEVLDALNQTLKGLTESSGEVMVEVKLYEIDTSRTTNIGTTVPTQFSVFNVDQAATQIVNSNQTLVQQAIAQCYISATASNLEIALALIGSGLVQSNLATNLIGVFAGGILKTGISASTNTAFNLGLNTTDARTLDDAQVRVSDGEAAAFREGTRYPITSSTYTTGLSTAGSALSNASINGVSISSLLKQYAGGTSATIPQVTYEDLGVSLDVTPVVERSGRVSLKLNLKIESLTGTTSNGNPILGNRAFASSITVADGESALLVSDISRTESVALTGIPGLSELPGFQMPTDENVMKSTSQLVLVVTPHVVRRHSELLAGPRIAVFPRPPG